MVECARATCRRRLRCAALRRAAPRRGTVRASTITVDHVDQRGIGLIDVVIGARVGGTQRPGRRGPSRLEVAEDSRLTEENQSEHDH
jgi:hypothetical protein